MNNRPKRSLQNKFIAKSAVKKVNEWNTGKAKELPRAQN